MDIPPELCLELLVAADYLDSKSALRHRCRIRLTKSQLDMVTLHYPDSWHYTRRIRQSFGVRLSEIKHDTHEQ